MDKTSRELSMSLEQVSKALSEWSVGRHTEIDPSLAERYGDGWRRQWVTETQGRIKYLAQALAVQSPEVLTETAQWSVAAFAARELSGDDVRSSLTCLREVIESELPESLAALALDYLDRAIARIDGAPPDVPATEIGRDRPHGELVLRYLDCVLDGRQDDGRRLVLAEVEGGVPVTDIYTFVIQPALTEIGRMWHQNEISIGEEHLATASTEILLSLLRAYFPDAPRKGRRLLATTTAGELHALGARMVSDYFEMDGWETLFFGSNMPEEDLVQSIRVYKPDLVALSVLSFLHLRTLGDLIDRIRTTSDVDHVRIIVGGTPFRVIPELWKRIGADGSASSASEAVELGNRLVEQA